MNILDTIIDFCDQANQTSSTNDKIEVIKKFPELKPYFNLILSNRYQYYVTPENLEKHPELCLVAHNEKDIWVLLDRLNKREVTGNKAISLCNGFTSTYPQYKSIFYRILNKNLETRTDGSLINQVFSGCVEVFDVALAKSYFDYESKVKFEKDDWYSSRKIDGCRLITIIKDGKVNFYSRAGNEFFTFGKIKDELESLNPPDVVLDGEGCQIDENGKESYSEIMKLLKKINFTIPNPHYKIFDILSIEDFFSQKSASIFSDRNSTLTKWFDTHKPKFCSQVEQTKIKSVDHLNEMMADATSKGWEGLIIRKDTKYEGKRSSDLLKVKKFFDAEYKVIGVENSEIRAFNTEGKEVAELMLSAVVIEHKGNRVNVGSGWTIDQRRYYYKHPEDILNSTICIQYFEEINDSKSGLPSLRFPTLKYIHGEKREDI